MQKLAWSYHEPDPADTDGLLGFLLAIPAMCLLALAAAPLLAWGQVNKVGDSRGSLRASLACVIQLRWVPRKMLAGQGNVYACAVVWDVSLPTLGMLLVQKTCPQLQPILKQLDCMNACCRES